MTAVSEWTWWQVTEDWRAYDFKAGSPPPSLALWNQTSSPENSTYVTFRHLSAPKNAWTEVLTNSSNLWLMT